MKPHEYKNTRSVGFRLYKLDTGWSDFGKVCGGDAQNLKKKIRFCCLGATEEDRIQLLLDKLHLCCLTVDFSSPENTTAENPIQLVKGGTLQEVSAYLSEPSTDEMAITSEERVYGAMVRMFASNIFRPLPPTPAWVLMENPFEPPDSADESETSEPAWPHLEVGPFV